MGTRRFEAFPSCLLALALALLTTARSSGSAPSSRATVSSPGDRASHVVPSVPSHALALDGATSLEDLGRRLVDGFGALDPGALYALAPTGHEYGNLLYGEFVRSGEPLLEKLGPQWGFDNLDANSREGLRKAFGRLRRQRRLSFVSITSQPPQARGQVQLYRGVQLRAMTAGGEPLDLPFVDSVVARDGRFKVLRFRVHGAE